MSIGNGLSVISETVFENRFMHVSECAYGADIVIRGQRCCPGVPKLRGRRQWLLIAGSFFWFCGTCSSDHGNFPRLIILTGLSNDRKEIFRLDGYKEDKIMKVINPRSGFENSLRIA